MGDEKEILQVGHALRILPAVDRAVITPDEVAELELGEAGAQSCGSEAFPDDPAAGEHPVGRGVKRHPPTL